MAHDVDRLAEGFGSLLGDGALSDVTLVVGDHRMPAHRRVLAARSDYFKIMFTIDLAEKRSKDVVLNDTSFAAFQPILNYAYTGKLDVKAINEQTLLEVLELSHRYQFPWVQDVVATHLAETVTINTVCERLNIAGLLNIDLLKKACLKPTVAAGLLRKQELVNQLSSSELESVLALNNVQVPEIDRFRTVCGWIEKHRDENAKPLLSSIRLSRFTTDELYNIVRPTNHYSESDINNVMHELNLAPAIQLLRRLPDRLPVYTGEERRQTFTSSAKEFIMKVNPAPYGLININTIQLILPSHLDHYSYKVDVLPDGGWTWSTVCGQDHCERTQTHLIKLQCVSHVRIRFLTGTVEQCTPLTVVASYSDDAISYSDYFGREGRYRAPKLNMATAATARLLPISKYNNKPDGLFRGSQRSVARFPLNDPANSLVVRFFQPYCVRSLVFLPPRFGYWCSYYVEVSDDNITWHRVCDKSEERRKGWQVIRFTLRCVVYVRIVGVHTSSYRFDVVHFECPIDEARLPRLLSS